MNFVTRTLLTIVTEAALEQNLAGVIERFGAQGYTVTDARGKGSQGLHDARWEFTSNIRIEVVCERKVAEDIVVHLRERYYDNFAMIVFLNDVSVVRADKF